VRLAALDLGELDLVRVALQSVAPRRETPLGEAEAVVGTAGRLEGFAVFFELRDGEARLTTAPALYAAAVPRATSWTQALFHVDAAPVVKKGDVLRLRASVAPDGGIDVLRLVWRRRPWVPFNVARLYAARRPTASTTRRGGRPLSCQTTRRRRTTSSARTTPSTPRRTRAPCNKRWKRRAPP